MVVPEEQLTCASRSQVSPEGLFIAGGCGDDLEIESVNGEGRLFPANEFQGRLCCYPVTIVDHNPRSDCSVGRPYLENGRALVASLRTGGALPEARTGGALPEARTGGALPEARTGGALPADRARAAAWARAGADEHASVAAFSRLALELMAVGAPLELLRDVQKAALDEVSHAESAWDLARQFGGESIEPGPFPFTGPVFVDVTLAALARSAAREGCLGETLGAHLVAAAAALATEPAVKAVLEAVAAEEARHAVLSYRVVAWALRTGGESVKAAVRAAFAAAWPEPDIEELALRARVEASALRRAAADGVASVLAPATAALFAA